ncbi:MAG: sensor signal transduction histidine kinase [bacterium]|nr:MAG: sensor signal transduction histidine kinase [bacterium]
MTAKSIATLVNLLGFVTGAALYAMLLAMVLRQPEQKGVKNKTLLVLPNNKLLLLTALLGFFWNIGAVTIYGIPDLGVENTFPSLVAASFTTLGFLPSVVVHLILRSEQILKKQNFWIAIIAYLLSGVAGLLHFYVAVIGDPLPSHIALHLLTIGFALLTVALLFSTRGQLGWQRAFWVVGLAVFAVSALHLSHHDAESYPWWIEMSGHHASLPLVVAILYQDYRFAFADIFLKRTISLVLLVITVFGAYISVAPLLAIRDVNNEADPLAVGLLLGLWVTTTLFYPKLRQLVVWFVDTIILKRVDYDNLRTEIARKIAQFETPEEILSEVCKMLTPALTAKQVNWFMEENSLSGHHTLTMLFPTTEMPNYYLTVGELKAGRRLLSDDLEMLEAVVLMVARRIDVVRVTHDRCKISLREQEISKLVTEAELTALRAQLNPHFLFNALTTLGYLIQTAPDKAFETLMRLTGLLRGVLRRSAGEFASIGEEIELVKAYLDIEKTRFEERLQVKIISPKELENIRIPSLLIQPLVENAIKHGITPAKTGGEVFIKVEKSIFNNLEQVKITVQDTGMGVSEFDLARGRKKGVGLANIERRLKCHYSDEVVMKIKSEVGLGTSIEVALPFGANVLTPELKASRGSSRG